MTKTILKYEKAFANTLAKIIHVERKMLNLIPLVKNIPLERYIYTDTFLSYRTLYNLIYNTIRLNIRNFEFLII